MPEQFFVTALPPGFALDSYRKEPVRTVRRIGEGDVVDLGDRHREVIHLPRTLAVPAWEATLLAPLPEPRSLRDFYAFEQHVATCRRHGARLAVDDAGAGFASLRHILELKAEIIKLDGSLTHSLEDDPRRRSLASALIEFGRGTGAAVVAEGIESELQVSELRRLGIRLGQGYHLGRPRPEGGRRFERRRPAGSA